MLHRITVSLIALAALAACTPRPAEKAAVTTADRMLEDIDAAPAASATAPPCATFFASRPVLRGPANYSVEGAAFGGDCTTATVSLVVRDEDGAAIYTFAGTADKLLGFETVTDVGTLSSALSDWVGETGDAYMSVTSDLPEWAAGAEYPIMGDFPFYVEGEMARDQYEALRAAAKPMYCHVQGRESLACLELEAPFANKIGVQALPG